MERNFNFENIGKQMPYTVPDGFFEQLEANVMGEIAAHKDSQSEKTATIHPLRKHWKRILLAAAAAVALFVVVQKNLPKNNVETDDFASVELAFNDLSTEDQDYLMEIYQEDFLIDNDL